MKERDMRAHNTRRTSGLFCILAGESTCANALGSEVGTNAHEASHLPFHQACPDHLLPYQAIIISYALVMQSMSVT